MKIVFCHDTFYSKKRDGTVYSYGDFPYSHWEQRFLPYFDEITVIGRKKKLRQEETGILDISSGPNIDHILLPNIDAPVKRLTKYAHMYEKIKQEVDKADAVVIRGPVDFGFMAAKIARASGKPYAVEMCRCAYDKTYFKGDVFNKAYAPFKFKQDQEMVRHAGAVIYTTESFLQSRYPTNGRSACAPQVEIDAAPESVLSKRLNRINSRNDILTLGLIGNFGNGLKGIESALDALRIVNQHCNQNPQENLPDVKLRILGQGVPALWHDKLHEYNLQEKVEFCGRIARGQAVLDWLDEIDIYLQPGVNTGLPRSLIEALSRGCTVLSSQTGGVAEVLEPAYIHARADTRKLALDIMMMMEQKKRLHSAKTNFEKSKNYTREILIPRRQAFWNDFAKQVKNAQKRKAA